MAKGKEAKKRRREEEKKRRREEKKKKRRKEKEEKIEIQTTEKKGERKVARVGWCFLCYQIKELDIKLQAIAKTKRYRDTNKRKTGGGRKAVCLAILSMQF